MEFLICQKHQKMEKTIQKVNNNAYICMNRYCPDSFKVFCSACKNDHRDHHVKILTIEDTVFLLERLQKQPFKETNRYIMEAVDVMKKLKLIKEFRKKIDILEKEMQKEAIKLANTTEAMLEEYTNCREGVSHLSEILLNIDRPENYQCFFKNSQQLLGSMEYNFKKDKFEYGNLLTKEKEDKRRKTLDSTRRKIEEVRDYSMKIIEVILNNCESDSEEEDNSYLVKHYSVLRNELFLDKNEEELDEEIEDLKNSKSTSNISRIRKACLDSESQTSTTANISAIVEEYEDKIQQLQSLHETKENTFAQELNRILADNEDLKKDLDTWKGKYQSKRIAVQQLYQSLSLNKGQRQRKEKTREDLVGKIMDLWQWKGLSTDDKIE